MNQPRVSVATEVVVTTTTGEAFPVTSRETVLEAALRAGVAIPYSCMNGTCRTCIVRVLSGHIEHDPAYAQDLLIDDEEVASGLRLLCSSFARSSSTVEVNP